MKRKIFFKIVLLFCFILLISGCALIDKFFGKTEKTNQEQQTPVSSIEEDEKAKTLISDFYDKLFSEPIEVSYKYNVEGAVPDKVKGMISEDTIASKGNTTELPIHYPRFVELNGMTIVGYEVIKNDNKPNIDAAFYEEKIVQDVSSEIDMSSGVNAAVVNTPAIEEPAVDVANDDNDDIKANPEQNLNDKHFFDYYVSVYLLATVVKNDDFGTYFRYNPETRLIDKLSEIPKEKVDKIRIKARYDVLLFKSVSGDYKIESAIEATAKQNSYRFNKINNEFIEQVSFFDMQNPKDSKEYQEETKFLSDYFKIMMLSVDSEKYNILNSKWATSAEEFASYLDILGLLKNSKQDYLKNILDKETYKNRFDIKAFPIKPGIKKVKSCEISVNEHLSFMEKQRNYRVLIDANVDKNEGKISSDVQYNYEIVANVSREVDKITINSYKLSQFSMNRALPSDDTVTEPSNVESTN
jgi:hypothetical protein